MPNPNHPLHSSIVRIYDLQGHVVGAGFLVSEGLICTCVHVITDALNIPLDTSEAPAQTVLIDFPFLSPAKVNAEVEVWWTIQPDGGGDIAILRLLNDPPPGAFPARLLANRSLAGRAYEVYGIPIEYEAGGWSEGALGHRLPNGLVQMQALTAQGIRVQKGFSGSPVWDVTGQGVVGIVVTADKNAATKIAHLIPNDLIQNVCRTIVLHEPQPERNDLPVALGNLPAVLNVNDMIYDAQEVERYYQQEAAWRVEAQRPDTSKLIVYVAEFSENARERLPHNRTVTRKVLNKLLEIAYRDRNIEVRHLQRAIVDPWSAKKYAKELGGVAILWGFYSIQTEIILEAHIEVTDREWVPSENFGAFELHKLDTGDSPTKYATFSPPRPKIREVFDGISQKDEFYSFEIHIKLATESEFMFLFLLGEIYLLRHRDKEAANYLERSIDAFISNGIKLPDRDMPQLYHLYGELSKAYYYVEGYKTEDGDKNFEEAENAALKAIEIQPNTWVYRYMLGCIYYETRQFEKASSSLEDAIAHDLELFDVDGRRGQMMFLKGHSDYLLGKLDEAVVALKAAVHIMDNTVMFGDPFGETTKPIYFVHPDRHAWAHVLLGNAYDDKGEGEKALKEYQRALEIVPNMAIAYRDLATFYMRKRDLDKALENAQMALKDNPDYGEAWVVVAQVAMLRGNESGAIEALEKAVSLDPLDIPILYQAGTYLISHGQPADGVKHLESALDLLEVAPEQRLLGFIPSIERFLGDGLLQLHRPAEALEHLAKSHNLRYDEQVLHLAACACEMLGNQQQAAEIWGNLALQAFNAEATEDAMRYAAESIRVMPDNGIGNFVAGRISIDREQYSDALKSFEAAVRGAPDWSAPYLWLGKMYNFHHLFDRAEPAYLKYIEIGDPDFYTYIELAELYIQTGRPTDAVNPLTKAIEKDQRSFRAVYNRGVVFFNLERYTESLHDLTKAIEIDPKYARAYHLRGRILRTLNYNIEAAANFKKYLELEPNASDSSDLQSFIAQYDLEQKSESEQMEYMNEISHRLVTSLGLDVASAESVVEKILGVSEEEAIIIAYYMIDNPRNDVITNLMETMHGENKNDRIRATMFLGLAQAEAAIEAIILLLDDMEEEVRKSAAMALINIGTDNVVALLHKSYNVGAIKNMQLIAGILNEIVELKEE